MDPTSFGGRLRLRIGGYSPLARWYRRARPEWLWQRVSTYGRVVRKYVQTFGLEVRHGPFTGLRFPREAVGRANVLPSKLLGSYEQELFPALHEALATRYDLFVEVGSGDGYYCVGFKMRSKNTRVMGFESDPVYRRLSQQVAKSNGATIEFGGPASFETLKSLPAGELFLMIDVEGYEVDLLNVDEVPRLSATTMLVELHDRTSGREVTIALQERFESSHTIDFIDGKPRLQGDWDELRDWSPESAHWALTEGRFSLARWMLLKPHDEQPD